MIVAALVALSVHNRTAGAQRAAADTAHACAEPAGWQKPQVSPINQAFTAANPGIAAGPDGCFHTADDYVVDRYSPGWQGPAVNRTSPL